MQHINWWYQLSVCFFICVFTSISFSGINDGLMAYYPFDGDAQDLSGNGNNGIISNNVTFVKGINGSAAKFDGINGYISVPSNESLKPANKLSVSLWLNIEQLPSTWTPVFHKGGIASANYSNRVYSLFIRNYPNTSNNFRFCTSGNNSSQKTYEMGNTVTDTWVHYAAIIDREAHSYAVYINGTLYSKGTDNYSSFNDNNNALLIGWSEEVGSQFLKGKIDDLRLYNRNLSYAEIFELSNGDTHITNSNIALNKPVTVSSYTQVNDIWTQPSGAVDGNLNTGWNSGNTAPGWIKIDLEGNYTINSINAILGKSPAGHILWQAWAFRQNDSMLVASWDMNTCTGASLKVDFPSPLTNINKIKINSIISTSWVALYDVIVVGTSAAPTVSLPQAETFYLPRNTVTTQQIRISNNNDEQVQISNEILNDQNDIEISCAPNISSIPPGDSIFIELTIDARSTQYENCYSALLKVTTDNNQSSFMPVNIVVLPPATPPLPDLSITASDINLTDYTINGPAALDISVHNIGAVGATDVPVTIYRFDNFVTTTTIGSIAPGATQTVQVTIPVVTSGEHLISVFIDSMQTIQELDRSNNAANKLISVGGQFQHSGCIQVSATIPPKVCAGSLFNISGSAIYDIGSVTKYVVKGGDVQIEVSGPGINGPIIYNGKKTNIFGHYNVALQAPNIIGNYLAIVTTTDMTCSSYPLTLYFTVIDACNPPPPPIGPGGSGVSGVSGGGGVGDGWVCGSNECIWTPGPGTEPRLPTPLRDLWIYSENIHFSNSNPDTGILTTICSEFKYWASRTDSIARNIPVLIKVITPDVKTDTILNEIIDRFTVGAPDFGSKFKYASWKGHISGIYIVEAQINPPYTNENKLNNAATRALIVGQYTSMHGALSGNVLNYYGGIGNIIIEVLNSQNEIIQSAVTNNNGFYIAENMPVGQFTVRCRVESPYVCDTASRIIQILDGQMTEADFYLYIPPILFISQLPEIRGECNVNVTVKPTATDQWGNTLQGSTTDPLAYNEPGTYIIRWLYTDASGKTASQTQIITVYDNLPPVAENLATIPGQCSVQIATPPTAIDNCAGTITGTTTSSLPLIFNQQGTYQVVWTFTDGHGNSSIQNQTVIVADNIAPVPDIINLPDITGTGSVSVSTIPTATDNCIGPVNGTTNDPLTYQQTGIYFITWNYTDGNGNTSSQQQKVVVAQSDRCITNLAARAKLDKIQLTWTNDGSSSYRVFRSTEGAETGFQQIATTTSTYSTYLDAGLVIGKRYWYKVFGDGSCSTPIIVSAVPEDRVRR